MAVDLLHGLHEHTCCLFQANLFQFYYWKHLFILKIKLLRACKVFVLCLLKCFFFLFRLNHFKQSCNLRHSRYKGWRMVIRIFSIWIEYYLLDIQMTDIFSADIIWIIISWHNYLWDGWTFRGFIIFNRNSN